MLALLVQYHYEGTLEAQFDVVRSWNRLFISPFVQLLLVFSHQAFEGATVAWEILTEAGDCGWMTSRHKQISKDHEMLLWGPVAMG